MEEIYRGVKITLQENDNTWLCDIDTNRNKIKSTLPEARKRIDNFLDKEKVFEKFDVILIENSIYGTTHKKGDVFIVTSEVMEYDSKYYWVNKDGKRSKELVSKFCRYTTNNRVLLQEIDSKLNTIDVLRKEIEIIKSKLTK